MESRPPLRRSTLGAAVIAAIVGTSLVALTVLHGAAATVAAPGPDAAGSAGRHPNIILLTTDDQTVSDMAYMPKTRELLADRGVYFRRSYVSYPLCCPARATLLTGQYAHNHGVLGNQPPLGGYGRLKDAETLPVWVQRAGYETIHIGKEPNGYADGKTTAYDYVPPGWSRFYGYRAADPASQPEPRCRPSSYYDYCLNQDEDGQDGVPASRTYRGGPDTYQTDIYASLATSRLGLHFLRRPDDPVFLQVHFFAPHDPASPATRHQDAFSTLPLPKRPGFNEKKIRDKPRWLRRVPRMGPGLQAKIATRNRRRLATLLAVDDAVEAIVAQLESLGELEDTFIIFTSDNGFMQGQHRIHQGKYLPYEPSARVPLIIRGPGLPAGRKTSELVSNADIVPTVTRLAGARPTVEMDGRTLLPFARRPNLRTRRPLLLETGDLPGRFVKRAASGGRLPRRVKNIDLDRTAQIARVITPPRYRAVRVGRWIYVEYENGNRELYDLVRDPNQLGSKAGVSRYKPVARELAKVLRRLSSCSGATCREQLERKITLPR